MIVYAFMSYVLVSGDELFTDWETHGIYSTREKAEIALLDWYENEKTFNEEAYSISTRIKEWVVM